MTRVELIETLINGNISDFKKTYFKLSNRERFLIFVLENYGLDTLKYVLKITN